MYIAKSETLYREKESPLSSRQKVMTDTQDLFHRKNGIYKANFQMVLGNKKRAFTGNFDLNTIKRN